MLPAQSLLSVPPARRPLAPYLVILFLLFNLLLSADFSPTHASDPFVASSVAANNDGQTHVLWTNVDGRINLMSVLDDGTMIFGNTLDGNADDDGTHQWQAVALTSALNGQSVVLWKSKEGMARLWTISPDGKTYVYGDTYGPYTNWTPRSIASGTDGTVYILWTQPQGQITYWTVNAPGTGIGDGASNTNYSPIYGPFAGWHASSVRMDGDNNAHIIWLNDNADIVTWRVAFGGGYIQFPEYTPASGAGWGVQAVSLGTDGLTHFLWNNAAGGANLWNLDDFHLLNFSTIYTSPAGWMARDLAARPDGLISMLWTNTNGTATVWRISQNNAVLNYGNPMGSFTGPFY